MIESAKGLLRRDGLSGRSRVPDTIGLLVRGACNARSGGLSVFEEGILGVERAARGASCQEVKSVPAPLYRSILTATNAKAQAGRPMQMSAVPPL